MSICVLLVHFFVWPTPQLALAIWGTVFIFTCSYSRSFIMSFRGQYPLIIDFSLNGTHLYVLFIHCGIFAVEQWTLDTNKVLFYNARLFWFFVIIFVCFSLLHLQITVLMITWVMNLGFSRVFSKPALFPVLEVTLSSFPYVKWLCDVKIKVYISNWGW